MSAQATADPTQASALPASAHATPAARGAWIDAAKLALLYALCSSTAIYLSRQPGSIAAVWIADAVAIAFLLSAPTSRWPRLMLGMAVGNVTAGRAYGDSWLLVLMFCLSNGAAVLAAAGLARRFKVADRPLDSAKSLLKLLTPTAVLGPAMGATLGAAALQSQDMGSFGSIWVGWFIGCAVGAVMTLPMAMAWQRAGLRSALKQIATPTTALLAAATVAMALLALAHLPYPFIYLVPPLVAAAFLVTPLAALTLCFVLGASVVAELSFGVMRVPQAAPGWAAVMVYVPTLLCLLPAQMLIVGMARERKLTNTLASLSSGTNDLILMLDLQGMVRAVNLAWAKNLGRTQAELVGQHWTCALAPGVLHAALQARVERALTGEPMTTRVTVPFGRGDRRTMDVSYLPAFGADGQRSGVIWSVHDVNELMQTQSQLERSVTELRTANAQLEQFARIASHDLREPLNTIVQFSDLIEQDHAEAMPPQTRAYFGHVRQGAARLRVMLDDMLQLARLERPGEMVLAPVALGPVVAEAVAALHHQVAERGATIDVMALPAVLGQASALGLLFQNLVSNAVKFVPPERRPVVQITAVTEGGLVIVSVQDNGVGIAAKDLEAIFEPFKRLHSRRKFEGTGLGLTICKRIVQSLEGDIAMHSAPGEGSRIEVSLKRA